MDKKKKDKEMKEQEIKEFDKLHAPTLKRTVSYSSKTFFVDALKKMVEDQIITAYTKDKLLGCHFPDLPELRDSLHEDHQSAVVMCRTQHRTRDLYISTTPFSCTPCAALRARKCTGW